MKEGLILLKGVITKELLYKLFLLVLPACILFLLTFIRPNFYQSIENLILNVHIQQTELTPINEKVIMIMGGDRSVSEIGEWPWQRDVYAELLNERLGGARTVVFDVMFLEDSLYGGDDELTEAIKNHGNVVLSYAEAEGNKPETYSLDTFIKNAAGEGYTNGDVDEDGIVRRYRFFKTKENGITAPSLVCSILMASGYQTKWDYQTRGCILTLTDPDGKTSKVNLDKNSEFIRFPAPAKSVATYEFIDVLNGNIPSDEFEDAIVLIGFSATGTADLVTTTTGVEFGTKYQSDSLYTVLTGFNPMRVPSSIEAFMVLALFLICAALTYVLQNRFSFFVPVVLSIVCVALSDLLFAYNIAWLSIFPQIISVVVAYLFTILYKLILAQRDLKVRAMSIESLLSVTSGLRDADQYSNFMEYIEVLSPEIEESSEIHILNPMLDPDSAEYQNFPKVKGKKGLVIAYNAGSEPYKHLILLELPFINDGNNLQQYALLGMPNRVPLATIKSVTAIIATSFVYFNASQEAKKRNEIFYNLLSCAISAIDAKDPITSGHSLRVAKLAEQIAQWSDLPKTMVNDIHLSGLIHDVGKIGIPDRILGKNGPLSDDEFKTMQIHPKIGGNIMQVANLNPNILDGILYHHERPDGQGYPFGKVGKELSISANIIRVADVFDALNSERQYKKAWSLERILNKLYENRGGEFDGKVVDVLIEHMKPEGWEPGVSKDQKEGDSPYILQECRKKAFFLVSLRREGEDVSQITYNEKGMEKAKETNGISFDFSCKDAFSGIEWHSAFYQQKFMKRMPTLLEVDEKSTTFVWQDENQQLFYYFLNNYLTMGAVLTDINNKSIQEKLTATYGNPISTDNEVISWDARRMFVFLWRNEKNTGNWVAYVMKSVLGE